MIGLEFVNYIGKWLGVSLGSLRGFIIGTWEGYLVGLSLGLPLGFPLDMDIGSIIGLLLVYLNPVYVIGSLIEYLYGIIIDNPPGSLPGSSVVIFLRALLGNCFIALLRKFHGQAFWVAVCILDEHAFIVIVLFLRQSFSLILPRRYLSRIGIYFTPLSGDFIAFK